MLGAIVYIVFIELHHELTAEGAVSGNDHPYRPVDQSEEGAGKVNTERESTI